MRRSPAYNPVEAWARDPKRVRRALDFLVASRPREGSDQLHRFAVDHGYDAETVHLAVAIQAEGGCPRCRNERPEWCPLGQELWKEVDAYANAYIEATGADYDNPAPAEWRAWLDALARLNEHRGIRHGG